MFCGECGTENPGTNKFCKNCGKPLRKGTAAAQPAPAMSGQVTGSPHAPAPAIPVLPKKRTWNWTGIVSLIFGILSWVILTTLLALVAIILGVFSLYKTRKETGKIAISAIAGIIIAVAAVLVSIIIR
jgi:uncharacterized membrane protein YvbJ